MLSVPYQLCSCSSVPDFLETWCLHLLQDAHESCSCDGASHLNQAGLDGAPCSLSGIESGHTHQGPPLGRASALEVTLSMSLPFHASRHLSAEWRDSRYQPLGCL